MGYKSSDLERFVPEPAKRSGRTEFMRDRARLIHSAALRRLAAKTQVAVPWENDFQRTRLSHSLECAQIGREFGASLGADPDLIDTACLAHDLGHPPFGHNGEMALAEIAKDIGGFEGNAQTFRILTRIEAKTYVNDRSVGLNLTRASLDACSKYPWDQTKNSKKFGVYEDDKEIFNWMRMGAPEGKRTFEAQIMDWSDDVSYSVHDFEDAIVANQISIAELERDLDDIYFNLTKNFMSNLTQIDVLEALKRLQSLSCWPTEFGGQHRDLAKLKDSTSQLIGRFITEAENATRVKHGNGQLTRFDADLEIPNEQLIEVSLLKAISSFYLIESPSAAPKYLKQREVIRELVEAIYQAAPDVLDPIYLDDWAKANSENEKLRVVIDQVASLTDPAAYALHSRLVNT
ncbi:MAG: hypothetical protein RLZ57_353 [Actinomycetota bacterium]